MFASFLLCQFEGDEVLFGKTSMHPVVIKFQQLAEAEFGLHKIPLTTIAKRVGVSRSHLQHLVQRELGQSCMNLIRAKSVERMTKLLLNQPEKSIAEIAYENDYEPQTMYRHFHAVIGMSPGAVRRQGGLHRTI